MASRSKSAPTTAHRCSGLSASRVVTLLPSGDMCCTTCGLFASETSFFAPALSRPTGRPMLTCCGEYSDLPA